MANTHKWLQDKSLDGTVNPTLPQLTKFSEETYTPFGYFFLDEAPEEPVPIPDFRTLAGTENERPSGNLLTTIYHCQTCQDWYRDYRLRMGEEPLEFVGAGAGQSVHDVAKLIRNTLGLDLNDRSGMGRGVDFQRQVLDRIEDLGVLVQVNGVVGNNTHRKLSVDEFRGFALSDDIAPLIFINGQDSKAAQLFTAIHELAHIYVGETALSDAPLDRLPNNQELWCNQVAAEVLVPHAALEQRFTGDLSISAIDSLSTLFRISSLVVLNQLFNCDLVSWSEYKPRYDEEVVRVQEWVDNNAKRTQKGGHFYHTQGRRFGIDFRRAVVSDTLAGQTQFTDAARLLGTKNVATVMSTAAELGIT